MENSTTELNVTKVARTLCHPLPARSALEVPIDGAEPRVRQSTRFLRARVSSVVEGESETWD